MHQMSFFFRLLWGVMVGTLALSRPSIALAHTGELHVGDIGIPIVVAWIGGGVLGAFCLFFIIAWSLSSRNKRGSQEGEKERNLQRAKEDKK